jgi:hypothetical protein
MGETFSTTGGRVHQNSLTGLTDGSTYRYYVRCKDTAENKNSTDFIISFSIQSAGPAPTGFTVDHTHTALSAIPDSWISRAKSDLHIAYNHTSHGSQLISGINALEAFPSFGTKYAWTDTSRGDSQSLSLDDRGISGTPDLSQGDGDGDGDGIANWAEDTYAFLDNNASDHINVIMWSWCNIAGHDVDVNYLPGMQTLIEEYGTGGSKIGTGEGQRENAVHFIFMTGHANKNNNAGDKKPRDQAKLITDFCNEHKYFCLDYYSIDTHDINDNYWEDAGDNGNSNAYGGNFYQDFQDAHSIGNGYFENKKSPGGKVTYGEHNTQHITANRKAYAMWWILARLAGWNGE